MKIPVAEISAAYSADLRGIATAVVIRIWAGMLRPRLSARAGSGFILPFKLANGVQVGVGSAGIQSGGRAVNADDGVYEPAPSETTLRLNTQLSRARNLQNARSQIRRYYIGLGSLIGESAGASAIIEVILRLIVFPESSSLNIGPARNSSIPTPT
ncbi:hypothetical protein C8R44DRAFT_728140 [Mycena epipterygia]|nr:hypothetical protein C8R44DRAFT_728140 [Mycena epipterygia]